MQAFEFRLEQVLSYQEKQKKLAELRRHQLLQALLAIEGEIVRLRKDLGSIAASMARGVGRSGVTIPWDALHAQACSLDGMLSAADQRAKSARAEFVKANEAFKKIATQVESLRELRQRRWQDYVNERELLEQQRIEEFVLHRWTEINGAARDD